ncbi:MAG: hypothetical protein LBC96_01975 [Lachnospiraceae bacterium]|jgi:hypothetical protein|nr:hypothetical protein [Lachnospiraceae bacterium]
MKKAKIFILIHVIALLMTSTAACGKTILPDGIEPPPSDSSSQATVLQTQDTSGTYNLSDGYNIEVIQTGERSGEIRLTDPHLRSSYPATSDSIPAADDLMYMWLVELKPANIMISVTWTNGQGQFASNNEITFNYMDANVFHVLPHDNVFLGNASAQVSGQTIIWGFDIPSETAFNWADVTEAEIIILNIPEQIYDDWQIPITPQTAAVTPPSDGTISMSLDKSTFEVGETIQVTVTEITSEWVANGAFVAIYDVGAPYNSYSPYQVHNFTMPGSGSFELTAPTNDGSFEVRLYSAGDINFDHAFYDSLLFTTASTTVTPQPPIATLPPASSGGSPAQVTLTLDKLTYDVKEEMIVTITGLHQYSELLMFESGAAHSSNPTSAGTRISTVPPGNSTHTLLNPQISGSYEVRLYTWDGERSDVTLVAKVAFTVTGELESWDAPLGGFGAD